MESDTYLAPSTSGHEPTGLDVRPVWKTGAALAALVAVALFAVAALMKLFDLADAARTGGAVAEQVPMPAGLPHLNPDQPLVLQELRAQERQILTQYEWIDRDRGIARIPIERAMAITATKGLPPTPPAPTRQSLSQSSTNEPNGAASRSGSQQQ